jgi:hypothetical protein
MAAFLYFDFKIVTPMGQNPGHVTGGDWLQIKQRVVLF